MAIPEIRPGIILSTILVATPILLVSCSSDAGSGNQALMHRFHRENFRMTAEELSDLQFYLSAEVLVRRTEPSEDEESGLFDFVLGRPARRDVVLVPRETPCLLEAAGDDWIRVDFGDGPGVTFLTDPTLPDDPYWLATEVAGEPGWQKVKDVPDRVFRHEGVSYRVLQGDTAFLQVEADEIRDLMDERIDTEGLVKEDD